MVRDIALDLGTTKVSVASRRDGLLVTGPAVVAVEAETGELVAFGHAAAAMVGRAPEELAVIAPIRGGVIVDFEAASLLIQAFLRRARIRRLHLPRVVACVPSLTTAVERRALLESIYRAGASDVRLLGHSLAGALGAGIQLDQPAGAVVVDIGGGSVEAAVVSLGGVVALRSERIGGIDIDAAIVEHLRSRRGAIISNENAEQVKLDLARADDRYGFGGSTAVTVRPTLVRAVDSGIAVECDLTSQDVGDAIFDLINRIVQLVVDCIAAAPPEICTDLIDAGIYLVGGGAQIPGLSTLLTRRTKLPVLVVEDPAMATIRGAQHCLGHFDELTDLFLT